MSFIIHECHRSVVICCGLYNNLIYCALNNSMMCCGLDKNHKIVLWFKLMSYAVVSITVICYVFNNYVICCGFDNSVICCGLDAVVLITM